MGWLGLGSGFRKTMKVGCMCVCVSVFNSISRATGVPTANI